MRIKNYIILSCFFTIFIFFNSCSGYEPIFNPTNLNFKISNHSIVGDKRLGNQLYSKISKSTKKTKDQKTPYNFNIFINISKNKEATIKKSIVNTASYFYNSSNSIKNYLYKSLGK